MYKCEMAVSIPEWIDLSYDSLRICLCRRRWGLLVLFAGYILEHSLNYLNMEAELDPEGPFIFSGKKVFVSNE